MRRFVAKMNCFVPQWNHHLKGLSHKVETGKESEFCEFLR
jgi:hypothetical protein